MKKIYSSLIKNFVSDNELPLYVVYRAPGQHPSRLFHEHRYTEIAMIVSGSAEHILENQRERVSCGDILLIHPGAVHGYDDTSTMEIINLIYDPNRLSLLILDGYDLPLFRQFFPAAGEHHNSAKPVLKLNDAEAAATLELIRKLEAELNTRTPGRQFCIMALFMQIIINLSRAGNIQNTTKQVSFQIGDAISYMNKHFQERIELDTLARTVNMSVRNFQRHFKNITGCSPVEFLIKIRLRNAAAQLINSDDPISMIALFCGFYDSNYFCKQFKENFGVTPKIFRLQHR
ncbi:MAG: helix-turn-helix domain-containing protein [Lentisphaeria bacterium]|nr:helix-turn-helix domain-containing protein [Lentisphaeria bacterium]